MRDLGIFVGKAAILVVLTVALHAASSPTLTKTNCAAFGYYDGNGRLVSPALLTAPLVDGRRISDEYRLRLHPILNRMLMHFGVDIAAPTGSPVHALADGEIVAAGRYGPSGLYLRIRHSAVYETAFAHLSAFGDGIRPGARVRRGQVVAFVGSTGLSTGPHLHFEIFVRHSRVRPACRCGPLTPLVTPSRVVASNRHSKPQLKTNPGKEK